jgi:hypothetical protein
MVWQYRRCDDRAFDLRRPPFHGNEGARGATPAMPLYWKIDSEAQLFEAECEGAVGLADLHRMLDAVVTSDALAYRKLFVSTGADLRISEEEMMALGVRLRTLQDCMLGPLALVLREEQFEALSRLLGILAVARRPIKLFRELGPARKWLESKSVLLGATGDNESRGRQAKEPLQPERPAT